MGSISRIVVLTCVRTCDLMSGLWHSKSHCLHLTVTASDAGRQFPSCTWELSSPILHTSAEGNDLGRMLSALPDYDGNFGFCDFNTRQAFYTRRAENLRCTCPRSLWYKVESRGRTLIWPNLFTEHSFLYSTETCWIPFILQLYSCEDTEISLLLKISQHTHGAVQAFPLLSYILLNRQPNNILFSFYDLHFWAPALGPVFRHPPHGLLLS